MTDKERNEMSRKIQEGYRNAAYEGTEEAWKKYRRMLNRLAKKVDANPYRLEDWALSLN